MSALNYHAMKNYQKVQVESASPEKLVLMLYDGAIRKLGQAESAHQAEKMEDFHDHIVRVQKIITELLGALDPEKGGELATNLERLYDYMLRQLSLALVRKNLDEIQETKTLLAELREGWKSIVETLGETAAPQATAAQPAIQPAAQPVPLRQIPAAAPSPLAGAPVSSLNISG